VTSPPIAPSALGGHADDSTVTVGTLGEAWLETARRILTAGRATSYDELPIRELLMLTLHVARPQPADELITRFADPERLAWMHANFTDHARVPALGDADSYATRLFDYGRTGRDQLRWVTERLQADPGCRFATITTFQPLTDTSYIPCVSLLDFYRRAGALELVVYAHSIDFGTKGYANLVELAAVQADVSQRLDVPVGGLTMIVKSAHVYATELTAMGDVVAAWSA